MSVEEGGVSAGGEGPSIGGGVGVSAGPTGGALGGEFGPSVGIGSTIVNEGPVAPAFLENTMPLTLNSFKPLGEIIFNPFKGKEAVLEPVVPSVIPQAEEIAAAAWKESKPALVIQQAEQVAAKAWETPLALQGLGWEAKAAVEPKIIMPVLSQAGVKPEVASRLVLQSYVESQAQPRSQLQQENVLEQQTVEKEDSKKEVEAREKEESMELKRKYVVDEHALGQIIVEIKVAVVKAKEAAGKLGIRLTGWLVDKFLPGQHPGNESEVVKGKGPDGSIPERKEAIYAHREFASETEAENTSVRIAYEKPPIRIRQDGQPVSNEDVYRVYKEHTVKPKPVTEVRMRVIKKETIQKTTATEAGLVQPVQQVEVHQEEKSIEDDPVLREIFQTAA